ncbi:MAG: ATP-grasp domain-containing protein [Candidatus Methylomirabilota bacterium]
MGNIYRTGNGLKLAVFYEHPEWFKPLFAELDRRGVAYERLLAHQHRFDPAERHSPYSLVVNRMSPSAYTRGHGNAILYTLQYLAYLKEIGANVLHGYDTYAYEFSKARQLSLLHRLGLRYPRARVINHPSQAPAAAEGLTFPVILKPNIGGSGAKIVRFDTPEALQAATQAEVLDLGIDNTALMQEYLPIEGNSIVRVEVLNGEYLYAIRLFLMADEFNLCPADYCRVPDDGAQSASKGLADGVSGRGVPIVGYTPPPEVIEDAKRITKAAQIEVGGVEYLINSRDGQAYYYDINALSNFVADAPNVVGFDPFPRLVDFLLARAGLAQAPVT